MKFIPYREFDGGLNTRDLLLTVVINAQPQGGAKIDEIERRIRIKRRLDEAPLGSPGVQLEDADHGTLYSLFQAWPFPIANEYLLTIRDDIRDAKEPPAIVKQTGDGIGDRG